METRTEVGVHESLIPFQQKRQRVVMVALIVDPNNRFLVLNGLLPEQPHEFVGNCTHEGLMSYVTRLVEWKLHFSIKRIYQMAKVHYPNPDPTPNDPMYVVVRVDVKIPRTIAGGEWVSSAERAKQIGGDDPMILNCAQLHMGSNLAWQTSKPEVQLS